MEKEQKQSQNSHLPGKDKLQTPEAVVREESAKQQTQAFHQRVDKHGRSFGDRVSTKQTRAPPPIQLEPSRAPRFVERGINNQSESQNYTSPQYVKNRRYHPYEASHRRVPFPQKELKEWRANPATETPRQENDPSDTRTQQEVNPRRNDQEQRVLEQQIQTPSQEEVMEELHEVTRQYLSCDNPKEAAARQMRVHESNARGLMEETAASIINTAIENAIAIHLLNNEQVSTLNARSPTVNIEDKNIQMEEQNREQRQLELERREEPEVSQTSRRRGRPSPQNQKS